MELGAYRSWGGGGGGSAHARHAQRLSNSVTEALSARYRRTSGRSAMYACRACSRQRSRSLARYAVLYIRWIRRGPPRRAPRSAMGSALPVAQGPLEHDHPRAQLGLNGSCHARSQVTAAQQPGLRRSKPCACPGARATRPNEERWPRVCGWRHHADRRFDRARVNAASSSFSRRSMRCVNGTATCATPCRASPRSRPPRRRGR